MGDVARMHQLAKLPVDMLGFIFYPRSPRYVVGKIAPEELPPSPRQLEGELRASTSQHSNAIIKVGVFVNSNKETILQQAKRYHLEAIQLHGSEAPELCRALKEKGYQILKAFNLTKSNDFDSYAPYCDYFLFDTPSEKHGGTGAKFDWSLLDKYSGETPFLLSGGIGPDDAEEIKSINHPQFCGIDINSKFEIEPGVKDVDLVKMFLSKLPPSPLKGETKNPKRELGTTKDNTIQTSLLEDFREQAPPLGGWGS